MDLSYFFNLISISFDVTLIIIGCEINLKNLTLWLLKFLFILYIYILYNKIFKNKKKTCFHKINYRELLESKQNFRIIET